MSGPGIHPPVAVVIAAGALACILALIVAVYGYRLSVRSGFIEVEMRPEVAQARDAPDRR